MQPTTDSRHSISALPGLRLIQQLFWGKLSRLFLLLLLMLLGSAAVLGLAITGRVVPEWLALAFALAGIALLWLLIYRMRRRLRFVRHLRDWAERMRGGDLSTKIPLTNEPDLDDVV